MRAAIAPHGTGRRKRKRASRRGERKRERQGGCNCNKVAATAPPVHAGVHTSVNAHASSRRAGASKRLAHWTATDVFLDCSSSRSPPAASPLPPAKPTTSRGTSSSRAVSCSSRKLPEVHLRVAEAYVGTDTRWAHIAETRLRPWRRDGSPNIVSSAYAQPCRFTASCQRWLDAVKPTTSDTWNCFGKSLCAPMCCMPMTCQCT